MSLCKSGRALPRASFRLIAVHSSVRVARSGFPPPNIIRERPGISIPFMVCRPRTTWSRARDGRSYTRSETKSDDRARFAGASKRGAHLECRYSSLFLYVLAPIASDLNELPTVYFLRSKSEGEGALCKANVIVVALIPLSRNSYLVGHAMQFIFGIGEHVTHQHSTVFVSRVIDVGHLSGRIRLSTGFSLKITACRLAVFCAGPIRPGAPFSLGGCTCGLGGFRVECALSPVQNTVPRFS